MVSEIAIAGPGFINIRLNPAAKFSAVADAIRLGDAFGRSTARAGEKVMVEFVSANPTGPLHTGHARQAALGDTLCNLLETLGLHGASRVLLQRRRQPDRQPRTLGATARKGVEPDSTGWPEDGYRGDYIVEIGKQFVASGGDVNDTDAVRARSPSTCCAMSRTATSAFGVKKFDCYYLESSLYTDGRVDKTVAGLKASGHTFEQDGALWLKTTDFGDDKDRVMKKGRGRLHLFRARRGLPRHASGSAASSKVVNIQGTDHHGTIARACWPAGHERGDSRLPGLPAAQHGAGDARRRRGEDLQARWQLHHARRVDRMGRKRTPGALLPCLAQGG